MLEQQPVAAFAVQIPSVKKNFDENGEMNENFYRDESRLESDANYFGSPEDI